MGSGSGCGAEETELYPSITAAFILFRLFTASLIFYKKGEGDYLRFLVVLAGLLEGLHAVVSFGGCNLASAMPIYAMTLVYTSRYCKPHFTAVAGVACTLFMVATSMIVLSPRPCPEMLQAIIVPLVGFVLLSWIIFKIAQANKKLILTEVREKEEVDRRKVAEENLVQVMGLNKSLEETLQQLDLATKARKSIMFNMAHELNTPMNAIMGFINRLETDDQEQDKDSKDLHLLRDSVYVMSSVVNNMLQICNNEQNYYPSERKPFSMEALSLQLCNIFQDMLSRKKVTFISHNKINNPLLCGEEQKLLNIYFNILSNAYKYTSPGDRVSMKMEELPCCRKGYVYIRTTIADTGIGISPDFLPHIFEDFSRADEASAQGIAGLGIGMPVVKKQVSSLDGVIDVKSKLGEGTVVTITIPLEKAGISKEEKIKQCKQLLTGKTVLLVEDNDLNAELATEILTSQGITVFHAENGQQCLDMLTKGSRHYDMILMDIQMPVMNGYEATKAIRQLPNERLATIPIIALTANVLESDRQACFATGMNGHTGKPINLVELLSVMAEFYRK